MVSRLLSLILALTIAAFSAPVNAQSAASDPAVIPGSREQVRLSFSPLVKQVAPAVVNIYTSRTVSRVAGNPFFSDPFFSQFFNPRLFGGQMRQQLESALGSGVIVQPDGLVVTNAHVVKGADEITIGLADGREFTARISLLDEASDIALLRAQTEGEQLPFAALAPSENLEVGDLVLAIGNPFGVGQTVTSGIVSAQGRSSLNINDFNFFIQTDAAINPGNSGGPLVALDGGVVGINTAIYSRDGGSLGIGFAIPSEMVASIIAAEKAGQGGVAGIQRPWLGVTAQSVTADIAVSLGMDRPRGALIAALHSASPLKAAGLKVGDVLLSIDGRSVRDAAEMKFRMANVPLGQDAQIAVLRDGKERSFTIPAMAAPDTPPRDETRLAGRHALSGALVANANPAVAAMLGVNEDLAEGVVVLDIAPGSPATRLVRRGDMLLEINGQPVRSTADIRALDKMLGGGGGMSLIVRGLNGQTRRVLIR